MRILLSLLVVIALGLAGGIALAVVEYGGPPKSGLALASPTSLELRAAQIAAAADAPRALVQSVDFDFGSMERGTSGSHEFAIRNGGSSPLLLEQGDTSCSCTLSGLNQNSLAPGESGTVTLSWTAKGITNDFRHWAKIRTNDPSAPEIEFAIHGRVLESIILQPELIRFDKPADTEWSGRAQVVSPVLPDLQITGVELSDPALAEFFAVTPTPETPTNPENKSQWSIQVTVKPGLPSGSIQQKIRLLTNFADRPDLELTVAGNIENDIRVRGARWNVTSGTLNLGQIEAGKEAVGELKVLAQGDNRDQVKLSVKEVRPSYLQVVIGEPQALAGGQRWQIPLTVTVPADAPAASYAGTTVAPAALIVLETNHPT
ncbi:MAG: DUF1573 domain-containing protein, partial [Planctomycetaceae bacterium]|nr:DUF1573 domain-containing protein [Planctomycetaceae bacterium]